MAISRQLQKINKNKLNLGISNVEILKSSHESMWVVHTSSPNLYETLTMWQTLSWFLGMQW